MMKRLKLRFYITFIIIINIKEERVFIIKSYNDIFNIAAIRMLKTILRFIRNVNLKL